MATVIINDEFRDRMNNYREQLVRRGMREKEMTIVPVKLEQEYLRLDDRERLMADKVISEWLQSEDSGTRWDAQCLIKTFGIVSALEALGELRIALLKTASISAPDRAELAKIEKLIQLLGTKPGAHP